MGPLVLIMVAAAIGFGVELWLHRWWASMLITVAIYLAYVALEIYVLPFHSGGFPGWEFVVLVPVPVVLLGAGCGTFVARWHQRTKQVDQDAL